MILTDCKDKHLKKSYAKYYFKTLYA